MVAADARTVNQFAWRSVILPNKQRPGCAAANVRVE